MNTFLLERKEYRYAILKYATENNQVMKKVPQVTIISRWFFEPYGVSREWTLSSDAPKYSGRPGVKGIPSINVVLPRCSFRHKYPLAINFVDFLGIFFSCPRSRTIMSYLLSALCLCLCSCFAHACPAACGHCPPPGFDGACCHGNVTCETTNW